MWYKLSFYDKLFVVLVGLLGILAGFTVPQIIKGGLGIMCGIMVTIFILLLDVHYASYRSDFADLRDKVDLQCRRRDKYYHEIATSLEAIIRIVNNPVYSKKLLDAHKRLNGVKGILEKEGAERELQDVLNGLKEDNQRFMSTSIANFADWIDPEWSTYLTRQLILTSQKDLGYSAERYFIYPRRIFDTYDLEMTDLKQCHIEGGTNMISILQSDFCDNWQTCLKSLLEDSNVNEEIKEQLRYIELKLRKVKKAEDLAKVVPDCIVVGDRFWWRDPALNWKLRKVYSNEVKELEAWIPFLDGMKKYRFGPYSTI